MDKVTYFKPQRLSPKPTQLSGSKNTTVQEPYQTPLSRPTKEEFMLTNTTSKKNQF